MTLFWPEDKDPSDVDYYDVLVDTTWLSTETISNAELTIPLGSGLSLGNLGISANKVRCQLLGGNPGTYELTLKVTTSTGRVRERSIYLVVKQR